MTNDQIYFPSPYALSQLSVYERVGARTDCLRRQHTYDVPVKKVSQTKSWQLITSTFLFHLQVYLNTFSSEWQSEL